MHKEEGKGRINKGEIGTRREGGERKGNEGLYRKHLHGKTL